MGGEAIKEMFQESISWSLRKNLRMLLEPQIKQKELTLKKIKSRLFFVPDPTKKRLNKPEWMIVSILPVIPPELRPLVH